MDKKPVNILFKILKILLPLAAIVMGCVNGSYMKITMTEDGMPLEIASTYFVFNEFTLVDIVPLLCMLLCIGAVVMAIVCAFKETEDNLVRLGHFLCIGMVADLLIAILMTSTFLCWCIAAVLGIALAITAVQEIWMENQKKKKS